MDEDRLVDAARSAMRRAYAPYSGYRVGAALLTRDGVVVSACNVENVSYGLTLCAERAAVARAVADGERGFSMIAVTTDDSEEITPCGACRQVLAEFAPDMTVVTEGTGKRRRWPLTDLLPARFESPPLGRDRKEEERT